MVRYRRLPGFRLVGGNGRERAFDEFLTDFNVVLLTRVAEASHVHASELLRCIVGEGRGVTNISVRGFHIRSSDQPCPASRVPHVVFQGRRLTTICDSGGFIRRLFGLTDDDWVYLLSRDRSVLEQGSIWEIERLSLQLNLDAARSLRGIARAPPGRPRTGGRDINVFPPGRL